jgi:pimeloyl-ACP methyl ester carboxylesterase
VRAALSGLPDGSLSFIPDCGHLPHVEHPGRFTRVLGRFLDERES